ncbi:MAG TPA: hypothetical protein VF644_03995 [Pyrinomonadaceae bacterium]|jgi:hypothetical protein
MLRFLILISICLTLVNCSKVETASEINTEAPNPTLTAQKSLETKRLLKPISVDVKLSSKRKKYLNYSLPPQVREVLEKAEKFEILAEDLGQDGRDEGMYFEPNRIARVSDENLKKEILEAFYSDAATDEPPAVCYIPHHSVRAEHQGKMVEIEICFECARFYVKSPFGEFKGTLVRENRQSEDVFTRVVKNQSVAIE